MKRCEGLASKPGRIRSVNYVPLVAASKSAWSTTFQCISTAIPLHPVNRGGICPHGAAGLDFLYHPDRIQQPLARSGARGSDWKAIGWDEALDRVSQRLRGLRSKQTPEQLGFFSSWKSEG